MKIELNEKESIRFAKALLTPRKPKQAMRKAVDRYRKSVDESIKLGHETLHFVGSFSVNHQALLRQEIDEKAGRKTL